MTVIELISKLLDCDLWQEVKIDTFLYDVMDVYETDGCVIIDSNGED